HRLMTRIARTSPALNAARGVCPAIAGAVIGLVGSAWCYFLNGLSYIAVIVGLLAIKRPPFQPHPSQGSAWSGFREVVRFLGADRRLRTIVLLTATLSVFGFPSITMMPVFARRVSHRGAGGSGILPSS